MNESAIAMRKKTLRASANMQMAKLTIRVFVRCLNFVVVVAKYIIVLKFTHKYPVFCISTCYFNSLCVAVFFSRIPWFLIHRCTHLNNVYTPCTIAFGKPFSVPVLCHRFVSFFCIQMSYAVCVIEHNMAKFHQKSDNKETKYRCVYATHIHRDREQMLTFLRELTRYLAYLRDRFIFNCFDSHGYFHFRPFFRSVSTGKDCFDSINLLNFLSTRAKLLLSVLEID